MKKNASTARGPPLRVTRLLNVLSASGVSVYALAFVLKSDIFSTCEVILRRRHVTRVTFWDNNSQSCLALFS